MTWDKNESKFTVELGKDIPIWESGEGGTYTYYQELAVVIDGVWYKNGDKNFSFNLENDRYNNVGKEDQAKYTDVRCANNANSEFTIRRGSNNSGSHNFYFTLTGPVYQLFNEKGTFKGMNSAQNDYSIATVPPNGSGVDTTPLSATLSNGNVISISKDTNSNGYFLRDNKNAEFYFEKCTFGIWYR